MPELFLNMARSLRARLLRLHPARDSSYVGESFNGSTENYRGSEARHWLCRRGRRRPRPSRDRTDQHDAPPRVLSRPQQGKLSEGPRLRHREGHSQTPRRSDRPSLNVVNRAPATTIATPTPLPTTTIASERGDEELANRDAPNTARAVKATRRYSNVAVPRATTVALGIVFARLPHLFDEGGYPAITGVGEEKETMCRGLKVSRTPRSEPPLQLMDGP